MLRPHTGPSAMNMRSSMPRHLGPVGFGCGMAASVHSAHGASLRPVLRVLPLRHALPVLLETLTGAGGLRVAHAREHELDVVTPPGGQHLALPLVGDSCVFVSHRRPFRKSMVLQRPLESTRSRKMSAPPPFFTSEGTLRDSRKSLQFRLPVPAASCFLVQEIVGTFPVAVPG